MRMQCSTPSRPYGRVGSGCALIRTTPRSRPVGAVCAIVYSEDMSWLDILFPKKCVNCGKWGQYVCESCEVGLWEEEQICPVCGRASRYGLKHKYCRQPYSLDGLTCLWAYEGVARKIISQAKYRFYYDMLSELLYSPQSLRAPAAGAQVPLDLDRVGSACAPGQAPLRGYLLIVPVPLYSKREKWRGFNQAEMIGRWLAETENLKSKNLLVRVKDTGQQVGKGREARLANIRGAFKLRATSHMPRAVLLVDDVWTSGATMAECCRVLKKAGVKYVWGWVLAR